MRFTYISLICILLFSGLVFAQEIDVTDSEAASDCIMASRAIMEELQEFGFNVERVNDSLFVAQDIFEAQTLLS